MIKNKTRYDFIDNTKGLALLIVISWHCYVSIFPHPVFTQWVLPFFFIVMGCFYKHNLSLKELIVKKANGLLVPWLILSIPAIILGFCGVKGFDLHKVLNPYKMIVGPCWFLISMFWSYLIYWWLNDLVRRKVKRYHQEYLLLACVLVVAISWSMNYLSIAGHRIVLPLFISSALTCTIFVGFGNYFKRRILKTPLFSWENLTILTICLFVCCISVHWGGGKSFNPMWNETEQPMVLVVLCSTSGSYIALQFCRIVPSIFKQIGKNTIPLLCIHMYFVVILSQYYPDIAGWWYYLIVLVVSIPLSFIICRYIPAANGKKTLFLYDK